MLVFLSNNLYFQVLFKLRVLDDPTLSGESETPAEGLTEVADEASMKGFIGKFIFLQLNIYKQFFFS